MSSSEQENAKASGVQKSEGVSKRRGAADSGKSPKAPTKESSKIAQPPTLPAFVTDPSNPLGWVVSGTQEFASDSVRLIRRCTKPDAREFKKIAYACAMGFLLMGVIGYVVKLVFIPINNIIVGG